MPRTLPKKRLQVLKTCIGMRSLEASQPGGSLLCIYV